jgi:hypothetical protein
MARMNRGCANGADNRMILMSPALSAVVVSSGLLLLAADDVPTYNFSANCRSETATSASEKSCVKEERGARGMLLKQWSQYAPSDRANCRQVEETAGAPSYVELLTCLQMAASAKKLPAIERY